MDTQSAMQIIKSSNEIKVLYKGSPIWIQGVNGDIARIKSLDTGTESEVPVNSLIKAD